MTAAKDRLIVILGPTAVGKTRLAVALARALGTEIVSGDSMLVYRGFDIGAAKPDENERGGVRHALVDILEPEARFNVVDFQRLAAAEIRGLNARGMIPVLAGGTGLYVKALLEGYRFNEEAEDSRFRARLEEIAAKRGKAYVHALLRRVDPDTAARLPEGDLRRVVRALEVRHLGRSTISREKNEQGLVYDACVIGLSRSRENLYARIEARVDEMMAAGLEAEVRGLLARGVPPDAQAMQGIGYKETAAFLMGHGTREDMVRDIKKATRRFAKRQLTWYRKMPYIRWFDADAQDFGTLSENVRREVVRFFGLGTDRRIDRDKRRV